MPGEKHNRGEHQHTNEAELQPHVKPRVVRAHHRDACLRVEALERFDPGGPNRVFTSNNAGGTVIHVRDIYYPALLGFTAAVVLNAIYFVLKSPSRGGAFRLFQLRDQQLVSYLAISEFIQQQKLPIWSYFAFRGLPVAAVLLIANATLNSVVESQGYENWLLLLSFLVLNLSFPFLGGKRLMPFNSIRITYLLMMGFVALVGVVVTLIATTVDISVLAINLSDIVSNLVAAFISAALVILYLQTSNMANGQVKSADNEYKIRELVLRHSAVILHKYGNSILRVCHKYNLNQNFVVSILTYEDLNRPQSIRKIENFFVRLLKLELTVGIAQVRSRTPLNDDESIQTMGEILSNLFRDLQLSTSRYGFVDVLEKYNGSRGYAYEVMKIYDVLQESASPSGPVG